MITSQRYVSSSLCYKPLLYEVAVELLVSDSIEKSSTHQHLINFFIYSA